MRVLPATRPSSWTFDEGGIVRGDRSRRELALVFTAHLYGEGAGPILDALAAHGARASFFLTGNFLRDERFRPFVRRMVRDGHYVGPHSDSHLLYCSWEDRRRTLVTREQFEADLQRNLNELRRIGALQGANDHGQDARATKHGQDARVPTYFMPPYEWYNAEQVEWARSMGVIIVNFTPGIGSNRDWAPESHASFRPSEQIASDILAYERREPDGLNGAILPLHLGSERRDKMHPHVEPLLRELAARGYTFLRIDELLVPR
jgi:peptidoglycan/xylan/chitin deacetylase (PgdA/CDA1 family)